MDLLDAMKARHSIRSFTTQPIEGDTATQLQKSIDDCNREGGLYLQLCLDEPNAFDSMMARYGNFKNVRNYIALAGKSGPDFEEKCGYYGQRVVLNATQLGLGTCWVAMTYSKSKVSRILEYGERLLMVIAVGHPDEEGEPHKSKSIDRLCRITGGGEMPGWFRQGMLAAQLAPTAMNQQRFLFTLDADGNTVTATTRSGFYVQTDLGIAKYHFELGAKDGDWSWAP